MKACKIIAAAGIAGALIFTTSCAPAPADASAPNSSAATATPTPTPTPTPEFPYTLSNGIVVKGVANDGKGDYLQTSIADSDPAMKFNPLITDAPAMAHFSQSELDEAQKVIVKFIAEEAIDSTLNDGTDVDGWFAAHKDELLPANQPIMLSDLKAGKDDVAREQWMLKQPGLSYAHGPKQTRVNKRTITPLKLYYVEGNGLKGVYLDTKVTYEMGIVYGENGKKVQPTAAEISYAAAKDPADGKWKIAGYNTAFHTTEYIMPK